MSSRDGPGCDLCLHTPERYALRRRALLPHPRCDVTETARTVGDEVVRHRQDSEVHLRPEVP